MSIHCNNTPIVKNKEYQEGEDFLHLHPKVIHILEERLSFRDAITKFLYGGLLDLYSPKLIPGITEIGRMIKDRLAKGLKTAIYCDYDVDGLTSAVLLHKGLKRIFHRSSLIYPSHRYKDGYGLSLLAVNELAKEGIELLFTVDCGISNHKELAFAKEKGMEVIVIDHHESSNPPMVPFLDLKAKQGAYPFRELCGCAMTWKLLQYLSGDSLKEYLDLVALATIADVVELKDENRILVKEGLKCLMEGGGNAGLLEILQLKGLEKEELRTHHIGFQVAPLLNASGRMDSPQKTLDLLLAEDTIKRRELAISLNQTNEERRTMTKKALEEALLGIDPKAKVLIYQGKIQAGVLGLVAGELKEKYNKAAIILGEDNRGSARSVKPLNMYHLLRDAKEFLEKYGGHQMAAGFTLKEGAYQDFYQRIQSLAKDLNYQPLQADLQINLQDLEQSLFEDVELLRPFGYGNPTPLFCTKGVKATGIRILPGGHLMFHVQDKKVIGYELKGLAPLLRKGFVDIYYYLSREGTLILKTITPTGG